MGHAHYRSYFLTSNKQGIYDFERYFNGTLSLQPSISNKKTNITTPGYAAGTNNLVVSADETTNHLAWKGTAPYYNIYAGNTNPVDISNPENLVYTGYRGSSVNLSLPDAQPNTFFAITAADRFGNESKPLQGVGKTNQPVAIVLLSNDGSALQLPQIASSLNATYYIIEDNLGNEVRRMPTTGKEMTQIFVFNLPNGFYTLSARFPNSKTNTPIGKFVIAK